MASYSVIITAGGIGKRMNSTLPKQFIPVKEKPILMRTIEQFYQFDPHVQIILTLPDEWKGFWEALALENDFTIPHRVISGGKERYDSVKSALDFCLNEYIVVHDGVRPIVSFGTLKNCFEAIKNHDAVIPVLPISESVRIKDGNTTKAVDRSNYMLVQTPQCFRKSVLVKAYEQPYHAGITDDATLVESAGYSITTVEGNPENIKITNQSDLKYAEGILK
ncbi:MAG: 2-C-methyl-D-erythritol 4-phosphate cytidylyltransferase [Crocinitomicaceae bacterium]|nr:2-C-methyl-D-erythritol 4-phosphate cytidylyltransferase [Crocinitomicaceae bacterium]